MGGGDLVGTVFRQEAVNKRMTSLFCRHHFQSIWMLQLLFQCRCTTVQYDICTLSHVSIYLSILLLCFWILDNVPIINPATKL